MFFGEFPYNAPFVYSRGLVSDSRTFTGSYCKSNTDSDFISLTYSKNEGISEQTACHKYLNEWKIANPEKKVLRVAFQNSIGGQVMLGSYLDLLIIAKHPQLSRIYFYVFEFAGSHFHGHKPECIQHDPECNKWKSHLRKKFEKYKYFERIQLFYKAFDIEMIFIYNEVFDCEYNKHYLPNKIPFKSKYRYSDFLNHIYSNKIKGFLVINGLSIRKSSRSPYQGIIYTYINTYTNRNNINYKFVFIFLFFFKIYYL